MTASQGEMTPALGMVSLCPQCRAALTPGVYECAGCKLAFRNERTLLWRTIFVPGGAYFYTKNPLVAALTLVGESFLLIAVFFLLAQAVGLVPLDPPSAEDPNPSKADSAGAALVIGLLYAFETMVTFYHNRKFVREFIPAA